MDPQEYESVYRKNFISNKYTNIGACWPDNEEFQETNEYKQVAACADSYLKQSSYRMELSDKSLYPVCYNLNSIIKQNQNEGVTNTWGSLASVFLLFTWYSLRILRAPWRKSSFKIKAYSGHFQHLVYSNFPPAVAEHLMERLGYIYHKPQQIFLFHQQTWPTGSWQDTLARVGMDFFMVHVRTSVFSKHTGSLMPVCDITSITSEMFGEKLALSESTLPVKTKHIPKKQTSSKPSTSRNQSSTYLFHPSALDRCEAIPNQYVGRDAMLHHHRAGSSNPGPSSPWQHKMPGPKAKIGAAGSEGNDDYLPLDVDPSLKEAGIRYPPRDEKRNYLKKKDSLKDLKKVMSLSKDESNKNYVTALPMTGHSFPTAKDPFMPIEGKMESGYYSEYPKSPLAPKLAEPGVTRRIENGEYVYAFPKRPPGDGEPTSNLFYMDIERTKMNELGALRSGSRFVPR